MTDRRLRLTALAGLALGTSACSSDPELWNAMAVGLSQAADEMAWENANCYWGSIRGAERYGTQQRYCPGDYGYQPPIVLPAFYYRRQSEEHDGHGHGHGHGHHDHGHSHGHGHPDHDQDEDGRD